MYHLLHLVGVSLLKILRGGRGMGDLQVWSQSITSLQRSSRNLSLRDISQMASENPAAFPTEMPFEINYLDKPMDSVSFGFLLF